MEIGFGTVIRFYGEKGFGFVSNIFGSEDSDGVFFHIKKIKETHPEIAKSIVDFGFPDNYRSGFLQPHWHEQMNSDISEAPFFWFEIEPTEKGDKVKNVLTKNELQKRLKVILPALIEQTESIWTDIEEPIPFHLQEVSEQLLGIERTIVLKDQRALEIKKNNKSLIDRRNILESRKEDNSDSAPSFEELFELSLIETKLNSALPENYDDDDQ